MMTPSLRSRHGFTLAELIIVMMIIVLLVAILLPALSSARSRARRTASSAQLASITSACESYVLSFNSNPGYFSETQLSAAWQAYTSTENLVVSLLGGVVAGNTYHKPTGLAMGNFSINIDEIGVGPTSSSGRVYGAFYSPKPDELVVVQGNDFTTTNPLPELVDTSSGMPILYFRSVPGRTTPVSLFNADGGSVARIHNVAYLNSTLTSADGEVRNQRANSVLCNLVAGSQGAGDNNLAWFVTAAKVSSYAAANNGANGADDVTRGFTVISPGADGYYADRNQLGGTLIDAAADLDEFDDIVMGGN